MWGFDIPDHPDIICAERTGYPRWIRDYEDDEDDEYNEDEDIEFIDLI